MGVHSKNLQKVCIKLLKPVRKFKILREIKILQILSGGPNIIDLHDVARDESSQTPCLIFEYLPNTNVNPKLVFCKFNDVDCRYYMF
jgi:casein kinase II subunit alpha